MAPGNRTLTLSAAEREKFKKKLLFPESGALKVSAITNKILCGDLFNIIDLLPFEFADLLIIDPPYNLDKNFKDIKWTKTSDDKYLRYLESWFPQLLRTLKPNGSVYICGDWKSTWCLYKIMRDHTIVRNRIIWQREKGRGAKANWKNTCEDIWFGTKSNAYYFDIDAVKQKRRVLAPYRENGKPKDWQETSAGNFRLTYPGNFWDDISVPYWSMPENTEHPAQKPEKLIAKLILASCPAKGHIFDPFAGSGTTAVAAKKLDRVYTGVEINVDYCCLAEKRLLLAETKSAIQGYSNGVFWERNTYNIQKERK